MRCILIALPFVLGACSAGLPSLAEVPAEAPTEPAPAGWSGVDLGTDRPPAEVIGDDDDAVDPPAPLAPLPPLGERRCDGLDVLPTYDPSDWGPHGVGVRTLVLEDPKRSGRSLTTELWYPTSDTGPGVSYGLGLDDAGAAAGDDIGALLALLAMFQDEDLVTVVETNAVRDASIAGTASALVVFSHGFRGVRYQSTFLTTYLASHGFVVAAPDHVGNTMFDGSEDAEVSVVSRVLDVAFVADELARRVADPADALYDAFDAGRVGVVGHSFGASTAINGGAMDNRELVNIPLAPAFDERMQHVWSPASYDLRAALTVVGGTADTTTPWAMQELAYERTVAPRHLVQLDGARHFDFTDLCANDLFRTLITGMVEQLADACGDEPGLYHEAVQTVTTASLNRYLACDADAGSALEATALEAIDRVSEARSDPGAGIQPEGVVPAPPGSLDLLESDEGGPTVALLRTPGVDPALFAPLAQRLAPHARQIVADPTEPLGDAVVLGWGAGGQAALQIPARARILVATPVLDDPDWIAIPGSWGGRTLTSQARVDEGDWDAVGAAMFAGSSPDPDHLDQVLDALQPGTWPAPADVRAALSGAAEPTLLIHGEADDTVLLESSLALWNELNDAELMILQRSGHLPFREEPDAFAAIVLEFLEGL